MAAFDLSRGIGDSTRMTQDVAVALCQPLIGYGVVFSIPKVLLKKHAIQKQLEKASVKLGHPTCKKTHAMQLEKQVKKKANEKARKKTKVVLFCCVFLRFFCRHPTPKRKNNLLFSFSIASFLLFVCVVFLLFSKV